MSAIDDLKVEDKGLTYEEAGHGIQSAIAFAMGQDKNFTAPKHLRVGIDLTKSNIMGLVSLLVDKGIITHDEYHETLRLAANSELARYEDYVDKTYGVKADFR